MTTKAEDVRKMEANSTRCMPPEREEQIAAADALGGWMSAALDDPKVCHEMKRDIHRWFDAAMPVADLLDQPAKGEPIPLPEPFLKQNGFNLFTGLQMRNYRRHPSPAQAEPSTTTNVSEISIKLVDVDAIREIIESHRCVSRLAGDDDLRLRDTSSSWADKLAAAIGDKA